MVEERLEQSGRAVSRVGLRRHGHAMVESTSHHVARHGALVEWLAPVYVAVDACDKAHAQEVESFLCEQQTLEKLQCENGD